MKYRPEIKCMKAKSCEQKDSKLRARAYLKQPPWTEMEDEIILKHHQVIRNFKGTKMQWTDIADEVNQKCYMGKATRSRHNCRERFLNHLDPKLVKGKWTEE